MCGIAAIISSDPAQLSKIGSMVEAQHMRGPDHSGTWMGEGVALGHSRLSLLDLSETGDQPMEGDRYVLTYNGEIYNHKELRSHCVGYRFKGSSDTETLLALIETIGIDKTLPKLNGMWAFDVWDKVDRVLTMAVDPLGIKPLYYSRNYNGAFVCASSSAAILSSENFAHIDPVGIARYFGAGGGDSVWHGISKAQGGEVLTLSDPFGLQRRQWYHPTFQPNAAEGLEDLIRDAIKKTATADVPVGIFFSGGIDTTIIASVHQGIAFHLDGPERQYAEQGAEHFGLDLRIVEPNAKRTVEALTDIARQSGEPSMAGFIPWLVSEEAAQSVKACISGNGADELFFGYDWINTPQQRTKVFRDHSKYGGADPEWPEHTLEDERFTDCANARWKMMKEYIGYDLNPTLDAASMCHGLEVRVPFLDVRLVEAALSLDQSFHGNKRVLKEMLGRLGLPKSYTDRPKYGFSMSATNAPLEAYKDRGWVEACQLYGMAAGPGRLRGKQRRNAPAAISDRDTSYLRSASAGHKAWRDIWKNKIR